MFVDRKVIEKQSKNTTEGVKITDDMILGQQKQEENGQHVGGSVWLKSWNDTEHNIGMFKTTLK